MEDIDSFFGEVINTSDVITFYGRSVDDMKREMATSIEAHLEACRTRGLEPGRPYSGRFNVRLSLPSTHVSPVRRPPPAKSMNAWIADILAEAAERELAG